MPLPSQIQLSNTFGQWVNTTNEIIKAVGNTSEYILVAQNATPSVSTGNVSVNGVMSLTSLKANGSLGTAGQLLTSNGNNVYWSTLAGATNTTNGVVNTAAQNFAGNKTFDNNVAVTGYLTVGNGSANVVINSSSISMNGSQVITSSGSANNASNFNGQPASYYTNASNLGSGTLSIARLDANVILTTSTSGINASALSTGTVPVSRLSPANTSANGVVDTNSQTFAGNKTFQNTTSFSNTVSITGATNALGTLGVGGTLNALGLLGVSGNATFGQDVTVSGNLTVSGTTTYINTANLLIGDNIIALNADLPAANPPTENAGLEINRGSSANTYLRWNETSDRWEFTNDGTNYSNVVTVTESSNASTLTTGTVSDARISGAYTNVTSLSLGANVVVNATTVFVGNSTANTTRSATSFAVANSTNTATLTPVSLTIGTSVANTIGFYAGANVYVNTTAVFVGNSTANTVRTATSFAVANSTNTATLTPVSLTIGTTVVNTTATSLGGTLSVSGAVNALSTLGVSGAFSALGTSGYTGAATFSNTVSITGAANALSTLGVGGAFSALGTSAHTGAATFSNTVSITGAANALSTLGVSGAFSALSTSGHTGAATFSNTVSITGAANALSTLGVGGAFSALGTSTYTGAATFSNTVSITGATNALSTLGVGGAFSALSTSGHTGAATFSNTVSITGAANALSTFGVGGAFSALGTSAHTGAATFSSTVSMSGAVNALSTLGVSGTVNALGALGVNGTLTALGQMSVAANVNIDSSTLFVDAVSNIVYVGKTDVATAVVGHGFNAGLGVASHTTNDATVLIINRQGTDGTLIDLKQGDVSEGSISVSGTTVTYGTFNGSHWSQLADGSRPEILVGTVMESIDALCEWPEESNVHLPKSQVSTTVASPNVYGVFMMWDADWKTTNDLFVSSLGAFVCRVHESQVVHAGDLLESNGDGTARVQSDDIIRSSTIGKVTSSTRAYEYADGSYCVPTVLYCG